MKAVYLYKHSAWGQELRYSIRSVVKYADVDEIVIIGDRPGYLQNVTHIKAGGGHPYQDVTHKMRECPTGDLLFMYDDVFLIKDYKPVKYYEGLLTDRLKRTGGPRRQHLAESSKALGNAALNYELHYPLPANYTDRMKLQYRALSDKYECVSPISFLGNRETGYSSKQAKDYKFKADSIPAKFSNIKPSFSTYAEDEGVAERLLTLYPERSIFEY